MKNLRAKTVDREHAYDVRCIDGQPAYALKYYQVDNHPYGRVKVSHESDMVGHDMYVRIYEEYKRIDNPLLPPPVVVEADAAEEYTLLTWIPGEPQQWGNARAVAEGQNSRGTDVRSADPRCEMCDTWVGTQFVNSYLVCDKPRCQDQAALLPDLGQPRSR